MKQNFKRNGLVSGFSNQTILANAYGHSEASVMSMSDPEDSHLTLVRQATNN